jgi:SpoIID/LytB domain protein
MAISKILKKTAAAIGLVPQNWRTIAVRVVSTTVSLGTVVAVSWVATASRSEAAENVELKVGIVQHFGQEASDELTLKAPNNGQLTLEFSSGNGQTKTLTTSEVTVEMTTTSLSKPLVMEKVVLSSHRSFESAEESANRWRDRGIEVELAHPSNIWQVWAKRDIYNTPLLRRLLLENLQARGHEVPSLASKSFQKINTPSWVVGNYRYHRRNLDISSSNNRIRVIKKDSNRNRGYVYPGSMTLQPDAYGSYTLVNHVPLESYLRGVVPYEIGSQAPYEAIKAQAIIARTYALRNLRRFQIDDYQLCADTHCQVYRGLTAATPTTDRAIAATQGLVLTYKNELIDALYFSTSGGVTAPYSDVWPGRIDRPYLQAVVDSTSDAWNLSRQDLSDEETFRRFINTKKGFNESGRRWFRWQEKTSLEDMAEFLKKYLKRQKQPNRDFTTIKQVEIAERSRAGRVLEMEVKTDSGTISIPADEIRNAFHPPISTLFYIKPVRNQKDELQGYEFIGGGFGHGVGLSQYGAYHLANLGWSSAEILEFYYPGTKLQSLNQDIVFWSEN